MAVAGFWGIENLIAGRAALGFDRNLVKTGDKTFVEIPSFGVYPHVFDVAFDTFRAVQATEPADYGAQLADVLGCSRKGPAAVLAPEHLQKKQKKVPVTFVL